MSATIQGLICTGLPQPLLTPDANPGYRRVRDAFEAARRQIEAGDADVIVVYSTMWPSVIGHQIQALARPKWVHVDELFHELGSMPYEFSVDVALAEACKVAAEERGLHARTVAYEGFPIDTGTVVALRLLNPDNRLPVVILSSNVYCDRAETVVFGKAVHDALEAQGKKAVAVAVSSLSNRLFTDWIDPQDDHIHSPKDDEWNRKILEFLGDGRLEDVAQLSREIHKQIRVRKVVNFKPIWWLSAVMGQHNRYDGEVLAYEAIFGTGATVTSLLPSTAGVGDKEYDEEDVEVYSGDRNVIASAAKTSHGEAAVAAPRSSSRPVAAQGLVKTSTAPKPVGAYPHARRVGDLLFISGMGPRQPGTDEIPGGPIKDEKGVAQNYDAAAQTRAVIENIRAVLVASGLELKHIVDVTSFLVDMDRDFKDYNRVYAEYFSEIQATRTTVAISALPTPIAVELKVVAKFPE